MAFTPLHKPINMDLIIRERDLNELRAALEKGWKPPRRSSHTGGVYQDLESVIRMLSFRWAEGFDLLLSYIPELAQDHPIQEVAISSMDFGLLSALIKHGWKPSEFKTGETGQVGVFHLMMHNLCSDVKITPAVADFKKVLDLISAAGVSIEEPYPGEREGDRDLTMREHTLFTFCIEFYKYDLLEILWPKVEHLDRHPRWEECGWRLKSRANQHKNGEGSQTVWQEWIAHYGPQWIERTGDLLDDSSGLISALFWPEDQRHLLWKRWIEETDYSVGPWTWMKINLADDPLFESVIMLAASDGVDLPRE